MTKHRHQPLSASEIRARLSHPIIDADGHWLEFGPYVRDRIRQIGGDIAVEGFSFFGRQGETGLRLSPAERRSKRIPQEGWWGLPTKNTRDRATAMMPKLLYERLDEIGLDFTVLYPSSALGVVRIPDAKTRVATCRAYNIFVAEYFQPYADRMTPAAAIPMHTPEEAVAELEYAKRQLGLKAVMMGSMIRRPIPEIDPRSSGTVAGLWVDTFGLDSEYDYDSVWAKCAELGISPSFHTGSRGFGFRGSPSNMSYNHIGHFAASHEALCKALYMGGVTRRFPKVNFGFLEGGAAWACLLYADLVSHWEKRSLEGLQQTNPANLDRKLLQQLARDYGKPEIAKALEHPEAALDVLFTPAGALLTSGNPDLDDFGACKINRPEDLRDLFADRFYFGCEADDRMFSLAFDRKRNPFGARLRPLFGSDIGHFDVVDMNGVLAEAYEPLEEGLMTAEDFSDMMYGNPVRFFGEANPDFFKATMVESAAAKLLGPGRR